MVCQACGNPVQGAFCSRCGAQVAAPPVAPAAMYGVPSAMMVASRVHRHVQTLGILWCVYGAYRAISGIIAGLFAMGMSSGAFVNHWGNPGMFPFARQPWMAGLGSLVAILLICSAVLSFAVGFSLMTRKPWGRTLAIVIAILSLINIPFGFPLGIYTLWVLAPAASGAEYDAISDCG
jgi:hypothetical protein